MSGNLNRGNKLWEGSRMFLPEHKQALLRKNETQEETARPLLDEQQLEEMNQRILVSRLHHLPVRMTYFKEGFFEQITGFVTDFRETDKELRIYREDRQTLTLKTCNIYDVQLLKRTEF